MAVVVFGIVVVVVVLLIAKAAGQEAPKVGESFICKGCGGSFKHTNRTVSAWKKGSRTFYCGKCHNEWHNKNVADAAATAATAGSDSPLEYGGNSGGMPVAAKTSGAGCMVSIIAGLLMTVILSMVLTRL